ncbi:MAG: LysR family transcriptional regulator [Pseudomonadales bacterium]|nr:LysR family transcriptional regulator [Pseudomonadales bacterium]
MKNLPMDVLRSFVTVAELRGFTQAGELLGRSQPAISLQIKRLEEMVGSPLLKRSGQQLDLTLAGRQLFDYAKKILALNDEALAQFIKPMVSGRIHFGIPSEFATALLPKIVGRFAQSYPSVTLEVTCDLSKNLLNPKSGQHFDLVLALHDNPNAKRSDLIKVEELVWVTSTDHQAHLLPTVPLIAAPEGCIYRHRGINALKKIHQPWRIVYTIPDLTGIQAAIEEGLGVTVLAKSTVPDNLQIIKPSDKFPKLGKIGVSLNYQNKNTNDAITRLVEFVKTSMS